MSARAVAVLVEGVRRADTLPIPVLRGMSEFTQGEWRSVRVADGLVVYGGCDAVVFDGWLVVGKPTTDPRGVPGSDADVQVVTALLDAYGRDTEVMLSGPWLALNITSGEVIRPTNQIVPWTRCESFGFRAWCTDVDVLRGYAVAHDEDRGVEVVVADPVPGFSVARLDAEIEAMVHDAPNVVGTRVWTSAQQSENAFVHQRDRLWRNRRAEAQYQWRRANSQGLALFAPQLERVVQDQFSYSTVSELGERAA